MTRRVLIICHNDPRLHPGGTEIVAHDLFLDLQELPGVEAYFLACVDGVHRGRSPGTALQTVGRSAREFLLWTAGYDRFHHAQVDHHGVVPELAELLRALRPDVVHLQHFLLFGVDLIALLRRVLPKARIILTLHEYFLICAHDGLMMTPQNELCHQAEPHRCVRCVAGTTAADFKLRETFLKSHLELVDHITAPSRFLYQRFVDWGIPPERISVVPNGRRMPPAVPPRPLAAGERRNRFAVFGNISPRKGQMVALAAARLLRDQGETDFSLALYGAPLFQPASFVDGMTAALAELSPQATLSGQYRSEDVSRLMAAVDWVVVPSIWWENAPLVIDEAAHHGRPVICSDLGGMAERVSLDRGLRFECGDPASLAQAMRRAMTPCMWDDLRSRLPAVPTSQTWLRQLLSTYWPDAEADARRRPRQLAE